VNLAENAYSGRQNLHLGGGLTPKHYFSLSRPPKGTTLAENTSYEPSCVVIGPAVWPGCGAKNTQTNKERTKTRDKLGVRPAHTLNLILTKFGMLGGLPDVFLKFEFQADRSINRSELWGRNLLFPIDKAHRLNNSRDPSPSWMKKFELW